MIRKELLEDLYINQRLSAAKCGIFFNVSDTTIRHYMKKHKLPIRSRSESRRGELNPAWKGGLVKRVCPVCKRIFKVFSCRTKNNNAKYCSQKCMGIDRKGKMMAHLDGKNNPSRGRFAEKSHSWKGEKTICTCPSGIQYYLVKNPIGKGRRREHIVIAEKVLDRSLKKGEVVHHLDGNGLNNKYSNLLICTGRYHSWLHNRMSYLYQQEHFRK